MRNCFVLILGIIFQTCSQNPNSTSSSSIDDSALVSLKPVDSHPEDYSGYRNYMVIYSHDYLISINGKENKLATKEQVATILKNSNLMDTLFIFIKSVPADTALNLEEFLRESKIKNYEVIVSSDPFKIR